MPGSNGIVKLVSSSAMVPLSRPRRFGHQIQRRWDRGRERASTCCRKGASDFRSSQSDTKSGERIRAIQRKGLIVCIESDTEFRLRRLGRDFRRLGRDFYLEFVQRGALSTKVVAVIPSCSILEPGIETQAAASAPALIRGATAPHLSGKVVGLLFPLAMSLLGIGGTQDLDRSMYHPTIEQIQPSNPLEERVLQALWRHSCPA